ncbi:hypothetical protein [Blastopirellula marina]|uniref:Uncharacterized protein n=1 Tax=Blastopirellula marina DSM 3645 TaxID=314230 RepID=A3ZP23_9BACT|nr:hypothetical protein [Blastopirellula marina]EAQ81497.1 hypothetical protein DSM3645_27987 [Blastopirellula marina DSM 3645]
MKVSTHIARRTMRFGHILTWCKDWSSDQQRLIDLLADAMHWCDAHGEDFHISFAQACRHYVNELNDDPQDECRPPSFSQTHGTDGLPSDPEGMNDSRADWATYGLEAFISQAGTDRESAMTDLLCNLMHLADRTGTHFEDELDRARMHYSCETSPHDNSDSPTNHTMKGTDQ